MTNIHDYLLWRGDISISKEHPLSEVDSLVLARFSYLPLDKINIKDGETIEALSKRLVSLKDKDFLYNGDKELATYIGDSSRFKNLLVTDYQKLDDKETEKQFGGVTIHLPNNELYVSYLGTDKTINGWKEDFNMAFMENVPCQITGLEYLENISKKYPNKKLRVGGHSKGGNIAIYASMLAGKSTKNKIMKVDNFDGPGLNNIILDKYQDEKIINKMETYIPQESIIGRLLNHKEKITICESNQKGILQHDIYSWHVFKNEFVKVDSNTKISEYVNNTVIEWLKNTTREQRGIFIDAIFEVFSGAEVDSFGEIVSSLTTTVPKILKKYSSLSEKEKKTMTEMIKKFIASYIHVLRKKKK